MRCLAIAYTDLNCALMCSEVCIRCLCSVILAFKQDLKGRLLTVNKASPRGSRIDQSPRVYEQAFRVYAGNLPWGVDNARLEQIFSENGKVLEARVVYDRETGHSRGFGFVTMSLETELHDAIAALDEQVCLDGQILIIYQYLM